MSLLIDAKGELLADAYTSLADDAPLPADGAVLVSLARWQSESALLQARGAPVALHLPNTANVLVLADALLSRPLIVIEFPTFADGRAYSQARLLRERLGYQGQLRAIGVAVVSDQLMMMRRVGINEFLLRDDQSLTGCRELLLCFIAPAYQPAAGIQHSVLELRRA